MVDSYQKRIISYCMSTANVQKISGASLPCGESNEITVSTVCIESIYLQQDQPIEQDSDDAGMLKIIGRQLKAVIEKVSIQTVATLLVRLFTSCKYRMQIRIYRKKVELSKLSIKTIQHLAYRLGFPINVLMLVSESASQLYYHYEIPKNNGKVRIIEPPKQELKIIQKKILVLLQDVELPDNIHSYRKGRSIKTNALPHVGKNNLLRIDIKDFYPNITNKMVYDLFSLFGCSPDVSRILTKLITKDGHLPQGAPTSPIIANHIIARIAHRINNLANKHGLVVTFYGDDIAVSGHSRVKKLKNLLTNIIRQEHFCVSDEKLCLLGPNDEKVIAGVAVGKKHIFAPVNYINEVTQNIEVMNNDASIKSQIAYVNWLNKSQGNNLNKIYKSSCRS